MVWQGEREYLIRPDGAMDIQLLEQGRVQRLYLEWDRGTMRGADTDEKCRTYAAYYASLARSGPDYLSLPLVLFVVSSATREATVWRALEGALDDVYNPPSRFITSQASLVDEFGPWGKIWRGGPTCERVTLQHALSGEPWPW